MQNKCTATHKTILVDETIVLFVQLDDLCIQVWFEIVEALVVDFLLWTSLIARCIQKIIFSEKSGSIAFRLDARTNHKSGSRRTLSLNQEEMAWNIRSNHLCDTRNSGPATYTYVRTIQFAHHRFVLTWTHITRSELYDASGRVRDDKTHWNGRIFGYWLSTYHGNLGDYRNIWC